MLKQKNPSERDGWSRADSYVVKTERNTIVDPKPAQQTNLSNIDFENGEKIELSANPETEEYSNLQYFCGRDEFENKLKALIGLAEKTGVGTVHGVITIRNGSSPDRTRSTISKETRVQTFENVFVKNLRVPRKYTPPASVEDDKRRSDKSNYKNIKGNFDAVCRSPYNVIGPYTIEFVLYDCGQEDAAKKMEKFENLARNLGLSIRVQVTCHKGR